jgi:hypothetical protein
MARCFARVQVRVCTLLTTALQNLLDPACEPALQASDLRCVLRCVRTVLHCFYRQLRSKCGVFVETLLAGTRRLVWLATHTQHCAKPSRLLQPWRPPAALLARLS